MSDNRTTSATNGDGAHLWGFVNGEPLYVPLGWRGFKFTIDVGAASDQ